MVAILSKKKWVNDTKSVLASIVLINPGNGFLPVQLQAIT